MNRFAPGDIIEIETPSGLAYVQVTHLHSSYPEVVRALPGVHADRPDDLDGLARQKTRFVAMVPLAEIIGSGSLAGRRIGTAAVPEPDRRFPTFKMAIASKIDGSRRDIAYWWLWDGDTLRYDAEPGPEIATLPVREVMTADALMARLRA